MYKVWVLVLLTLQMQFALADSNPRLIQMNCMSCHNQPDEVFPDLKSLSPQQMLAALLDFKYERRPSLIMGRIVKGFSEQELADTSRLFYP